MTPSRSSVPMLLDLVLLITSAALVDAQTNVVWTPRGYIQGFSKGQTIRFMGIPYAASQRFQYPTSDHPLWNGTLNATGAGPMCYQYCDSTEPDLYCLNDKSENCLTLNVFRPIFNPSNGRRLPVIVYIHGGDFSTGSGAAPAYDADYFASKGQVIVVTFNYRLGAFGYLSIFDKYGDAATNFGFRDQQAALTWIKTNIVAFDGDPDHITLIGDGPGCLSAVAHLQASSRSQPLFHAAVLQSCPWTIPFRTRGEAKTQAQAFSRALGCNVNDVVCYRKKTPEEILRAQMAVTSDSRSRTMSSFYEWGLTIDDHEIFHNPLDIFKDASRFASKPLLLGVTADEGIQFVYQKFRLPISKETYDIMTSALSGNPQSPSRLAPQTLRGNKDWRDDLVSFVNSRVFACPTEFVARQMGEKQSREQGRGSRSFRPTTSSAPKVWMYEFTLPTSLPGSLSMQQQQLTNALLTRRYSFSQTDRGQCDRKSCHGSDIRTLFFSSSLPLIERLKTEDTAKEMIRYWSNFARYGNVNGIIASRSHLRMLQIQTALVTDTSSVRTSSRSISRLGGLTGVRQLTTPARLSLQSALASFTYWPEYWTRGEEAMTTMLLQAPLVELRRSFWQGKCRTTTAPRRIG